MESSKNNAQVLIDGKVLTLSGFESEEYLQQVAAYLNSKISDCQKNPGFKRQPADLRNIMISLNIADDYFKAKARGTELEEESGKKEKEVYNLKHELIVLQMQKEKTEEEMDRLKTEVSELQKQVVKLETELKSDKK